MPSIEAVTHVPDLIESRPEGLYCPAGDFYIDPMRPVCTAIITHGHGDHARGGSAAYHCSQPCLPILHWRLGKAVPAIGHDYGESFTIGDAIVSLHPAGHVLGSAQVRIEVSGHVCVVTGDYKRDADPTCTPFEVVPCDTFVTESTFAIPVYRWPPIEQVIDQMAAWLEECAAQKRPAMLLAYSLGKAQRILAELMRVTDRTVYLHGAMHKGVRVYREQGIQMLPTQPVSELPKGHDFSGELIMAPPSAAGSAWMKRFPNTSTAFASGWMRVRGTRRWRGHERGFVVSDHADWPSLIRTIAQTGAKRVLAYHGKPDVLVRYLREQGVQADALTTGYGMEEDT